ncbi:unnamed protein product [Knipowitschia caucasica]
MASGVTVTDNVKSIYEKMKLNKKSDSAEERIRVVELKLSDDFSLIDVRQIVEEKDLEVKGNVFKYVQSLMVPDTCTYILYDCHYKVKENPKKEDLIFIMWNSTTAPIKLKMLYSSSKSAVTKIINVKHVLEITDEEEKELGEFVSKLGKNVTEVDGLSVK